MKIYITACSKIFLAAIVATGCTTKPFEYGALDGCDVDRSEWSEIAAPPNRDALLDLPQKNEKAPVRNLFAPADGLREVWFESLNNDDLQLCIYDVQNSCEFGGTLRKVIFTKPEASWEAGAIEQLFCITD